MSSQSSAPSPLPTPSLSLPAEPAPILAPPLSPPNLPDPHDTHAALLAEPPDYASISNPDPRALAAGESQSDRNREKQAIRDLRAVNVGQGVSSQITPQSSSFTQQDGSAGLAVYGAGAREESGWDIYLNDGASRAGSASGGQASNGGVGQQPPSQSDGSGSSSRMSALSQGPGAAGVGAGAGPFGVGVGFHAGRPVSTNGDLRGIDQQLAVQSVGVRFARDVGQSGNGTEGGWVEDGERGEGGEAEAERELGYRGVLPVGMDVREALAKCEDPGLSWSLRFWVTIADPLTQHVFFACPASGQCSWDPPVGAFVVPRSPDGEWWELSDASRGNRSYYYNTLTGKTQWTRPGGDAFVVPLGLIQRSALPPQPTSRESLVSTGPAANSSASGTPRRNIPVATTYSPSPATSTNGFPRSNPTSPTRPSFRPSASNGSISSPTTPTRLRSVTSDDERLPTPTAAESSNHFSSLGQNVTTPTAPSNGTFESHSLARPVIRESVASAPATSLAFPEEGGEVAVNGNGAGEEKTWWERRRSSAMGKLIPSPRRNGRMKTETISEVKEIEVRSVTKNFTQAQEPIPLDSEVRTKRLSTGLHPLLPSAVSSEIQAFRTDDFAERYFATQRTGMLRQRVPLERITEWQRSPISAPLLVLSKLSSRDAVSTFKVIQHVMGERDKPVEGARSQVSSSTSASGSTLNLAALRTGKVRQSVMDGEMEGKTEKMVVLEEIRWMIQLGVLRGEMRDEIYCQLVKQLTKNPDHEAVVLGFQLFCVLVAAFAPSKNFETFVKAFLQRSLIRTADGINVMAKHCITKIEAMAARGGRGRILTLTEIEHASDAAFYPSVYGQNLETVMRLQESSYPDLKIPIILPFLADGILALGGTTAEGIFRIPGDGDLVADLRARIDRGHYQLNGIDDPHVAASLFKLWLRELEDPVVPTDMYDDALASSRDPLESVRLVAGLPELNRRVLLFVVSFIQMFLRIEVVEVTKMTAQNIALVLAPNILRTTSNSLNTVFTNSNFESRFVLNLLTHLNPRSVDAGYKPTHGAVPAATEASEAGAGSGEGEEHGVLAEREGGSGQGRAMASEITGNGYAASNEQVNESWEEDVVGVLDRIGQLGTD